MTTTVKSKKDTKPLQTKFNKGLKWWDKANTNSEQMARWMSLYEAVNIIADKAKDRGIPWDDVTLPPIKLQEYMDDTVDIYHRKLLQNVYGVEIFFTDKDLHDKDL